MADLKVLVLCANLSFFGMQVLWSPVSSHLRFVLPFFRRLISTFLLYCIVKYPVYNIMQMLWVIKVNNIDFTNMYVIIFTRISLAHHMEKLTTWLSKLRSRGRVVFILVKPHGYDCMLLLVVIASSKITAEAFQ